MENLEENKGVSGNDFLDKIVQVVFDVPHAKEHKIHKYLLFELNRVLAELPDGTERYFDNKYWGNVFNSGFKDFFTSIRDVKRYISSLKFNIGLLHQGGIMEVNPVDFIAIEALRVFAFGLYSNMRNEKTLFTDMGNSYSSLNSSQANSIDKRKEQLNMLLSNLPSSDRTFVLELLKRLFPQLDVTHSAEFQEIWSRHLRVCSDIFFDIC